MGVDEKTISALAKIWNLDRATVERYFPLTTDKESDPVAAHKDVLTEGDSAATSPYSAPTGIVAGTRVTCGTPQSSGSGAAAHTADVLSIPRSATHVKPATMSTVSDDETDEPDRPQVLEACPACAHPIDYTVENVFCHECGSMLSHFLAEPSAGRARGNTGLAEHRLCSTPSTSTSKHSHLPLPGPQSTSTSSSFQPTSTMLTSFKPARSMQPSSTTAARATSRHAAVLSQSSSQPTSPQSRAVPLSSGEGARLQPGGSVVQPTMHSSRPLSAKSTPLSPAQAGIDQQKTARGQTVWQPTRGQSRAVPLSASTNMYTRSQPSHSTVEPVAIRTLSPSPTHYAPSQTAVTTCSRQSTASSQTVGEHAFFASKEPQQAHTAALPGSARLGTSDAVQSVCGGMKSTRISVGTSSSRIRYAKSSPVAMTQSTVESTVHSQSIRQPTRSMSGEEQSMAASRGRASLNEQSLASIRYSNKLLSLYNSRVNSVVVRSGTCLLLALPEDVLLLLLRTCRDHHSVECMLSFASTCSALRNLLFKHNTRLWARFRLRRVNFVKTHLMFLRAPTPPRITHLSLIECVFSRHTTTNVICLAATAEDSLTNLTIVSPYLDAENLGLAKHLGFLYCDRFTKLTSIFFDMAPCLDSATLGRIVDASVALADVRLGRVGIIAVNVLASLLTKHHKSLHVLKLHAVNITGDSKIFCNAMTTYGSRLTSFQFSLNSIWLKHHEWCAILGAFQRLVSLSLTDTNVNENCLMCLQERCMSTLTALDVKSCWLENVHLLRVFLARCRVDVQLDLSMEHHIQQCMDQSEEFRKAVESRFTPSVGPSLC